MSGARGPVHGPARPGDPTRGFRVVRVIAAVGAVVSVLLGVACLWFGVVRRDGLLVALSVFFLGYGIPGAWIWLRGGPQGGPPRPVVVEEHRGRAVTVVPSRVSRRSWPAIAVLLSGVYVMTLGGAYMMQVSAVAVGFFVIAAILLVVAVLYATGRIGVGDLFLDPEGISQHAGGREQWIAWKDIQSVDADPTVPDALLLTGRAGAGVRQWTTTPPGLRGLAVPSATEVRIDVQRLDARAVLAVVEAYHRDKALRRRLGSPASVDDIAAVIAGDGPVG